MKHGKILPASIGIFFTSYSHNLGPTLYPIPVVELLPEKPKGSQTSSRIKKGRGGRKPFASGMRRELPYGLWCATLRVKCVVWDGAILGRKRKGAAFKILHKLSSFLPLPYRVFESRID